jgi:putative ABC transport system permease protein
MSAALPSVGLPRAVGAAGAKGAARPRAGRWRAMARVGLRMMVHDKLKMLGTLLGVVFAVLLSNQQAGTFLGLMHKNTMFVNNAGADIWMVPMNTAALQPTKTIPEVLWKQAAGAPGVAWAQPLLFGAAQVSLPGGGTEAVTVIGTKLPAMKGGPWNLVAGDKASLAQPDTMIFEDGVRELLGGLNLGSVREVSGRKVQVGGFTWGLLPFGPAYSFADYDFARLLLKIDSDQTHFVLVGVKPGENVDQVKAELQKSAPRVLVLTRSEFERSTMKYILTRTAIGVTFGTSTIFGLVIGFVIVSLTTFSAVVDNIREFGTLKAIGATTWDLAKLLFAQAVAYALLGSLIGIALITQLASAVRSPNFGIVVSYQLALGTTAVMVVLCLVASSFALLRLRKLEPAMVFR